MMDATEDVALRNILLDAAAEEFAAELSDPTPVITSLGFQRKMKAMLANPQRWAKRYGRPLWKRYLQTAVAVLLVCTMSLGTLMAVSPTVRAAVINWAVEWYESHIVYRYSGEQLTAELPKYQITDIPEGYTEVQKIETQEYNCTTYQNEMGDWLQFDYAYMQQGSALDILTEDVTVQDITVNGLDGQLFLPFDPASDTTVVWVDPDTNLQFTLSAFLDKVVILHIVGSISLEESTK